MSKPLPVPAKTINLKGWGNATQLIKGYSSTSPSDIMVDFTNAGVNQVSSLQLVADEGTSGGSLIGANSLRTAAPTELKLMFLTLSGLMGSPNATVDCGVMLNGGDTIRGSSGGGIRNAFLFDVSIWNAVFCPLYARNVKNLRGLALNLVNTPRDPSKGITWIGAGADPDTGIITPSENVSLHGQFSGTVTFDGATSCMVLASGVGDIHFTSRSSRNRVIQPPGSQYSVRNEGFANLVS
jgi:hypothetical protein